MRIITLRLTSAYLGRPFALVQKALLAILILAMPSVALAITGNAPPANGAVGRSIVMLIDDQEDLCTGTAVSRQVILTAAHCVVGFRKRAVKVFQTGSVIPVRASVSHPHFSAKDYSLARATADLALVRLAAPLPDIIAPVAIAPARRVQVGEMLTIAGFGVTQAATPYGLGIPRQARLAVTGNPGSIQIRLVDSAAKNEQPGLGACTGDSGAPAFDQQGDLIGIVSWSTAPKDQEGCGGLSGLTPLFHYREWVAEAAAKLGKP